ncbi:protein N-terminal and lysine N-methyltransferase efm7 [Selaginella moellendorffii]|uniref:protein N-terminal and lysine N-methyltransferase efm7 n=1 Tax=Selaginella moellendorffii TaxID=88036 RepID=UPI000D1CCBE3|nr:protein N-terminal and lysine N-methyltransferase efm7 [Selaginella moellendorffii]XP_024540055.1 protein N-terminal and lysine N-methyltransferase efm7 [Selaginella moellendorffii]|eukprot:XP_024540054.1 protein N-terminal and lysine N-methyltransferase efm7 [Selaginella moellendorffii]
MSMSSSIPLPNRTYAPLQLELSRANITVKNRRLSIVQPKDEDQVLDMYIGQEKDPYWCRVWPSSMALAEEIFCHPELVAHRKVCDLGAGLGLAGLAAAFAGAKEVVLLDQEPLALVCSLLSFHANFPGITTNVASFGELLGSSLDGLLAKASPEAPEAPKTPVLVTAEIFDWTEDRDLSRYEFDTVLACDLLYMKSSPARLAKIAPQLLKKGGKARLLLTDPVERTPGHRDEFLRLLQSTQLKVVDQSRREPEMDGKVHQIELLSCETQA